MHLAALAVLLLAWSSQQQGVQAWLGGCSPDIKPFPKVELEKLGGVWYEVLTNGKSLIEKGGKCQKTTWTYNKEKYTFKFVNEQIASGKFLAIKKVEGEIIPVEKGAVVKGSLKSKTKVLIVDVTTDLTVVATDYYNYIVLTSCRSIPLLGKYEIIWVLARNPYVLYDPECKARIFKKIYANLKETGCTFKLEELKASDQKDCKYD